AEGERERKKLGLGRTRSADKCANLVRILFPGCAFDTGRYVDARRTRDAQRLQHIVGVKPAGKHKWDTGFDVLEKCPVKRLTQPSWARGLLGGAPVEYQTVDELGVLANRGQVLSLGN